MPMWQSPDPMLLLQYWGSQAAPGLGVPVFALGTGTFLPSEGDGVVERVLFPAQGDTLGHNKFLVRAASGKHLAVVFCTNLPFLPP